MPVETTRSDKPFFSGKIGTVALLFMAVFIGTGIFYFRNGVKNPLLDVPREELTLREGTLYRTGGSVPFDGFLIERYKDEGILKSRSAIITGKMNGVSEGWYTNGVMQVREHFTNGVSHGLREKWHENGAKMSEVMIVNGKLEGLFQRWHDNGQLAEQIEMKQGDPNGLASAWYPSGFVKAQAKLQNGKVLDKKSWADGELKESAGAGVGL